MANFSDTHGSSAEQANGNRTKLKHDLNSM